MKILIIGGVAGGATAAARLRRNDESAHIVLIERGPYISFANCGLPYHISGMIAERDNLLVTSKALFETRYRVDVRNLTEAIAIDRRAKTVRLRNLQTGEEIDESYDKLLLSPGGEAVHPKLAGIDSPRVFSLRNIPDLDRIMGHLTTTKPRRAVVIGGGYIGIEMAENLHERGLFTTLVEGAPHILAPFDDEMAAIVHSHMKDKNIELYLADKIEHFEDKADHTVVFLASGKRLQADIVVLAIGVRPETTLARAAGLELGITGGIKVNEHLQTSDADIYAVGDAVEVTQTISGQPALIALAGPANRQGRMAADNMLAAPGALLQRYKGTLGTAILKAFDLAAACTGLNEGQLQANGLPYHATITHSGSHASYYPGAKQLSLKLLYAPDGRIYGAQAVGADGADKRVDVIATAIHAGLTVQDLCELELAYAPPFGSAKDPVNIAGYVATNVLNGSHEVITWHELRALDTANAVQLVDVRTPEEFEIATLPNAKNVELDHLRERLHLLDKTRPVVVFCQIGVRGYLAYRILKQSGFADVRNLTGGFKTYAWAIEKQANPDIFDYEDIKRRDQAEIEAEQGGACAVVAATPGDRHTLDAVGLQCPGPIMKTYRAVEAMQVGELLEVTASDPAFGRDIRAWAKKTHNDVLSVDAAKGLVKVLIRKGQGGAPAVVASAVTVRDKLTLVVFSDDLDKVMASMIIANGALAMGKPVSLFFTFWGLNVLRRTPAPHVNKPLMDRMFGAMLPQGIDKLDSISKLNNAGLGVKLLRKVMRDKHVDDPASLLATLVAGGAQLIACQMSMDVMGIHHEELIDGVELGGVAAFLGEAQESGTTLFI